MTSQRPGGPDGPPVVRASDVTALRVKHLRRERGLTAAGLAGRCAELGAPAITTNVVSNIETRRRDVNVDELLVFALALDVPPTLLLMPDTTGDDSGQSPALALTPQVRVGDRALLSRWIRGDQALPVSKEHLYEAATRDYLPTTDTARGLPSDGGARLLAQFEASAAQLVSTVRAQVNDLLSDLEDAVIAGKTPADVMTALGQARSRLSGQDPAPDGAPSTPAE